MPTPIKIFVIFALFLMVFAFVVEIKYIKRQKNIAKEKAYLRKLQIEALEKQLKIEE